MDLISIITPIKNNSQLFKSTYLSVIQQTHKNFEWLIIDDGSTDIELKNISNIIDDDRVKYIIGNKNLGPGGARNLGLDKISGNYLSFIDSDDLWGINFLSTCLRIIKEQKCGFVFSGYRRYMIGDDKYLKDFIPNKTVSERSILKGSDISCLTALIDTNLIDSSTRFGNIPTRNDLVFFYRVLKKDRALPINEVLATYRINNISVSSNKLRALKYQYLVNKKYAGNSFVVTTTNIFCWIFYGIKKYGLQATLSFNYFPLANLYHRRFKNLP